MNSAVDLEVFSANGAYWSPQGTLVDMWLPLKEKYARGGCARAKLQTEGPMAPKCIATAAQRVPSMGYPLIMTVDAGHLVVIKI